MRSVVEVVVLGSGTPNPTPDRAGAATAVVDGAEWVLVDCGRAVTQRALEAGLDLVALVAVLITHHHSDHISDLATLATTRWTAGATTPLPVVVPSGPAATYVESCLAPFPDGAFHGQAGRASGPRPRVETLAFDSVPECAPVLSVDGWTAHSALVDHHPIAPAVGYRIQRGSITVAVSGDTAVCDGVRQLATGVDVLVHEALLTAAVRPSLLEWNAGAGDVGALAAEVGVGTLVLTHLLPAPASAADDRAFLDEVRAAGYDGPAHVARDLLRVHAGT
jgi:ribonuclease Z